MAMQEKNIKHKYLTVRQKYIMSDAELEDYDSKGWELVGFTSNPIITKYGFEVKLTGANYIYIFKTPVITEEPKLRNRV